MPATLDIEFPFGIAIQQWFCPVCGQPLLPEDYNTDQLSCPHVDWIYLDDIAEFLWQKPQVAQLLNESSSSQDISQEDDHVQEKETGIDTLIHAWDGKTKAVFVFTTGGIACGPVWSTIRIGLDFSIPPSDE